mmetsp:Transcript_9997/g.15797  ORF Transcript_9997/g.15797 Transcript_9997/m.15797 type:complete len:838 (-) Transcript_9997:297-2810(-)
MPSSQSHRSAVSVNLSPSSHVTKQLERANDLERQLSGLSKSNDEKAARLRSHLCEILSELVISHPLAASESDCSGRMWKSCFYAPIGVWRSRISREKRKHGASLASLEQSFQRFLGEAVTLYDFLVLQYKDKLVQLVHSTNQDTIHASTSTSPQDSQVSEVSNAAAALGTALVPGLHRLYIHLGDLHRYGEAYSKAEACYENASKLAPGMGNPYNQLAVVAQMKDSNMSCVALYWYARSLFATHDSFHTSGNNLERLFRINREYLRDHARDPKPPILPAMNKKASADLMRAQKTAASRSCLAHFVDFHFDLILNEDMDSGAEKTFREKLDAFQLSFRSLLQASAFGDALLCKMVVVAAFSIEMITQRSKPRNRILSEDLLFTIGTALGERIQHALAKISAKAETIPSSIRVLLPYLLLCEYIGELDSNSARKAEALFWNQCALTENLARKLSKRFDVNVGVEKRWEVGSLVSVKEHHLFRDFKPFAFLNTNQLKEGTFISPSDAVSIFNLPQSLSHQSSQSTANGYDLTVAKLVRFIQVYECFGKNKPAPDRRFIDDELECNDAEKALPSKHVSKNGFEKKRMDKANVMQGENNVTQMEPKSGGPAVKGPWHENAKPDAGSGVLDYNTPKGGDCPALLIPAALSSAGLPSTAQTDALPLLGETRRLPVESKSAGKMATDVMEQVGSSEPPLQAPVLGITPPPGFGAQATQVANAVPVQPQYFDQGLQPSDWVATAGVHVSAGAFQQLPASVFSQNSIAFGNSVEWFGARQALESANPFASPGAHFTVPPSQDQTYDADTNVMDGAALLGSGFLDSLWTNDAEGSQTKNPFATNMRNQ